MELEQAKKLRAGDTIFYTGKFYPGKRFKVTSVKRWKREPDRIEIRLKYGLYQYYRILNSDLVNFSTTE